MRKRTRIVILAGMIVCAAQGAALGQAVQLPTFRQFSVSTTVSVPDSGGGVIGGVGRASSGSSQRGLPVIGIPGVRRPTATRSTARSDVGGNLSVGVQIHDFDAMDHKLLAESLERKAGLPHRASESLLVGPQGSLAGIRRGQAEHQQVRSSEVDELLARGRKAGLAGKPALAQTYFRMAARQASGQQRADALEELQASKYR